MPHLQLYMTTNELSVFGKNDFNMQYMNNRRSRWPCGMRQIDCRSAASNLADVGLLGLLCFV